MSACQYLNLIFCFVPGDTSETQPRDDQDDIGESRILTPELFNDTGPNDDGIAQVEQGSNEEVDTGWHAGIYVLLHAIISCFRAE